MRSRTHTSPAGQPSPYWLDDVPGVGSAARSKLASMGVDTLETLCQLLSRQQLKRLRHVGPGSYRALSAAVAEAGLSWPEFPAVTDSNDDRCSKTTCTPSVVVEEAEPRLNRSQPPCYQASSISAESEQSCLQLQIDAWIEANRRPQWVARQQHQPGAYGSYLKAQLDALDALPLSRNLRQQARHRIIRLLGRYRREVRVSATNEAIRERVRAGG